MKIPQHIRSFFDFWMDNSLKRARTGQNSLDAIVKSIQEVASKAAMASGGILSDIRSGLLGCLPVLENHGNYLRSMAMRKQKQNSDVSSAVDCVVQNIAEREKITLIEIGGKDVTCLAVKNIVEALKEDYDPVNISTLLPVNRKKRFKLLNHFLVQQSPVRLALWTFDNHGTAPQSVFAFLVKLEDDPNTIMKHISDLRTDLLAQQKIYYPREFRLQLKYYSSSIVDVSSAPMRMLMAMVLGDSRGAHDADAKLVEERVLDAILSGDDELALDLRAFNGRESQYVKFLAVVRRTLSEFLAEDKNRWQTGYDGTVVSNMSMAFSLHALFALCVQNALKEDPQMPIPASDKYLSRYLYPRTAAAAAAVSTSDPLISLRWAVQQKVLEKPNPDSYYNMSQYKSLKTFAVSIGNDDVTMVSTDDKAGIDVGEPDLPIVACQHPGKSWTPSQLKLGEGQHSFHKLNLTPSVRLVHRLPPDVEGSFYRGKPQLTLKDAVFEPSSGARHFTELTESFAVNPSSKKPVTIITNDGGPDHNIHHDRNKAALLAFFLNNPHILYLANFQMAANRSSYHPVEKLNCILNLSLNGVALARKVIEDSNFEKLLKSCNSMVDIRKKAEHNPGLNEQVTASLKDSKEIIENRAKQASLKEDFFEVFDPSDKKQIEQFMDVLKSVDADFEVSDYLDTKKKFHITGSLLKYYEEVSTTTYYCVTMTRHRNMSAEFLNSLYPGLNLPFDLHPIPCPVRDPENPDKYLKFEDLYHSSTLRSYDDKQRPGKVDKASNNIPFPKNIIRARYCSEISIICVGCDKRRVVYSQYKPTHAKIDQARTLLESMRYQCGASLCTFGTEGVAAILESRSTQREVDDNMDYGEDLSDTEVVRKRGAARPLEGSSDEDNNNENSTNAPTSNQVEQEPFLLGNDSIFSVFFVDESLTCTSPVEKHLYDILEPSVTISAPCYYCGETDLVRTSVDTDQVYPLCQYCRTVKKFGPVLKRKKRSIVPRPRKRKNKRKNNQSFENETEPEMNDNVDDVSTTIDDESEPNEEDNDLTMNVLSEEDIQIPADLLEVSFTEETEYGESNCSQETIQDRLGSPPSSPGCSASPNAHIHTIIASSSTTHRREQFSESYSIPAEELMGSSSEDD